MAITSPKSLGKMYTITQENKQLTTHNMTLEDTHLQVDLPNAPTDKLLNYDIILRVNDDGDAYEGFSLYNYENQEEITWVSFNK